MEAETRGQIDREDKAITEKVHVFRLMTVLAVVALLFAIRHGLAPLPYLASGSIWGVVFMFSMLYAKKTGKQILAGILFGLNCSGIPHLCANLFLETRFSHAPWSFLIQWLSIFALTAFGIISLFGYRILPFFAPVQRNETGE